MCWAVQPAIKCSASSFGAVVDGVRCRREWLRARTRVAPGEFSGLHDDRPKPKTRHLLRAIWRTLPFFVAILVISGIVSPLGGPSWLQHILVVAPVVVFTFFLDLERDRRLLRSTHHRAALADGHLWHSTCTGPPGGRQRPVRLTQMRRLRGWTLAAALVAAGALVVALVCLLVLDSLFPFFVGLAVSCVASMAMVLSGSMRGSGDSTRRDGSS